jgi:hypothetical protein
MISWNRFKEAKALIFREPVLEDMALFEPYRNICSDYVFSYLYMYKDLYKLTIAVEEETIIIRSDMEPVHFYMPLGNTDKGIKAVLEYCRLQGIKPLFTKLPQESREVFAANGLQVEEDRASFDYIFRNKDFLEFKGKEFRKQRNNLFSYLKAFTPSFDENIKAYIDDCKAFTRERHSAPDILKPTLVILDQVERFDLKGGVVLNEGAVAAFCLYEEISEDMIQSHVELTGNSHRGTHAYLINEMAKKIGDRYINKEDDMGLPGLRKFKETFNPCTLLKKYKAY